MELLHKQEMVEVVLLPALLARRSLVPVVVVVVLTTQRKVLAGLVEVALEVEA
jgi:hypothetical protein